MVEIDAADGKDECSWPRVPHALHAYPPGNHGAMPMSLHGTTKDNARDRHVGLFTSFLHEVQTLKGTISRPVLEVALGPAFCRNFSEDANALNFLRSELFDSGFAPTPNSSELVRLLNAIPDDSLHNAGVDFRKCVGLSRRQMQTLDPPSRPVADVVLEVCAQLETALPADVVLLGPIEGTFRGERGGIPWLHNDEHRTAQVQFEQALFPLSFSDLDRLARDDAGSIFEHYNEIRDRLHGLFPDLALPPSSQCPSAEGTISDEALRTFTTSIIRAIEVYQSSRPCLEREELVLDVVNVWIPRGSKRMALLPMNCWGGQPFEGDTRPSVSELEAHGLQHKFEAFSIGTALLFFGRYVLHQMAEGPDYPRCPLGSMETRFLVLSPRSRAHRCALNRRSCISYSNRELFDPAFMEDTGALFDYDAANNTCSTQDDPIHTLDEELWEWYQSSDP